MGTGINTGVLTCQGCGGIYEALKMRGYNGNVLCPHCLLKAKNSEAEEEEKRVKEYCATHLPEGETFVQIMPFKDRVLVLSTNSVFELKEDGLEPIRFVKGEVANCA